MASDNYIYQPTTITRTDSLADNQHLFSTQEMPETTSKKRSLFAAERADSSINFAARPWCKPTDYWKVYFAVTEGIKKRFDAENITIPFPQRDVHLYEHKAD